jgi:hypothetical protein
MIVSNILLNFQMLERAMDLPEGVQVVGVQDNEQGSHVIVRVISPMPPRNMDIQADDPLSKIGIAFAPPPPPVEVADVEVIRAK